MTTTDPIGLVATVGLVFLAFQAHFMITAGVAWYALWVRGSASFRRIRTTEHLKPPRPLSELAWSTFSIFLISLMLGGVHQATERGWTSIYYDLSVADIWYLPVSIVAMALVHDCYQYWAHRALHSPRLFRNVHRLHHSFNNPTPWACYAFHPVEAVILVGWFLPLCMLLPLHPAAVALYVAFLTTMNVVAHLGFELGSVSLARWGLTTTHHSLHHSRSRGHYMLYLNLWDRAMGTNQPDYYDEVAANSVRESNYASNA